MSLIFFECVARAVVKNAVKALIKCLPFGEALYDIAKDTMGELERRRTPQQRLADLAAVAAATPEDARRQAAVAAAAATGPSAGREKLAAYLERIPGVVRRSLARPDDMTGRTVPAGLPLDRPEDIVPFLPPRPPRFQPDDRVIGRGEWVLEELVGVGGFGEVWKARPAAGGDPLALKFCLETGEDALGSLETELELFQRLRADGSTSGIVPLRFARLDGDPPFLAYDYVPGGDLARLIGGWHLGEPSARLVPETFRLVARLAEIVSQAHQLTPPVVHRDLKPSNILLQPSVGTRVRLRVTDVGIGSVAAEQALRQAATMSRKEVLTTGLRGAHSPLYASPQQRDGRPADPRDDVHALGVVWYQMLTGELHQELPPDWKPILRGRGATEEVIALLGQCLASRRERRLANAAALAAGIRRLLPEPDEVTNTIGMRLARIPAGRFLMGSPEDEEGRSGGEHQHEVELTRAFYLGVYPVTQGEYEAVMGKTPSYFAAMGGGAAKVKGLDTSRFPVEQVSHDEAVEFCRRLTEKERKEGKILPEQECRLPTEAEWEYSCRGGASSSTPFHFGATLSHEQANFERHLGRTCAVGSYPANGYGLHDMHGNVWEWCADWYDEDAYEAGPFPRRDPLGPPKGSVRVIRGGSWESLGQGCRSALRSRCAPSVRDDILGFRVALVSSGGK